MGSDWVVKELSRYEHETAELSFKHAYNATKTSERDICWSKLVNRDSPVFCRRMFVVEIGTSGHTGYTQGPMA